MLFLISDAKLAREISVSHTQMGTIACGEQNIPKWVWHRGWSYSNFAVDNSAVSIAHRLSADMR